jgi:bifunctional N-acetylglucosamine-1-phosphate-uridyltransferase/glucosamine-1-phosphate-acetyltransferase GlmU-like protein
MLNFVNLFFVKSRNQAEKILGREAWEYLTREFCRYDYTMVEKSEEAEDAFRSEAVNIVLPLDMPLVREDDLQSAIETMKRKKIKFARLGGLNGGGELSFGKALPEGVFITGDVYLQLDGAKSRQIVYNCLKDGIIERLLDSGVEIFDYTTTHIDDTADIAAGAKVMPFCIIKGDSVIKSGATVAASYIENSVIESGAFVQYSHLTDSRVCARASVGPFARLRSAEVGEDCRVGDYVEIKASTLESGVKAAHLAYIGDATVGENTNVGCGTVFCNYDGVNKNKTQVGKNCFIGANTNLIAPLSVGDNAFIAAGTTVNQNIEEHTFTIGRVRQETKKK